ncbi:MAG: hypothetical protein KDG53_08555, partial [Rhodocyclaceae bacterium]|nr:hypothetical protein [Rhodocyclaceae bacterium]
MLEKYKSAELAVSCGDATLAWSRRRQPSGMTALSSRVRQSGLLPWCGADWLGDVSGQSAQHRRATSEKGLHRCKPLNLLVVMGGIEP